MSRDMIKDEIKYEGKNLGAPIVIREDISRTYMLYSVIDDIDYQLMILSEVRIT